MSEQADDSSSEGCEFRSLFRSESSSEFCGELESLERADNKSDASESDATPSIIMQTHRCMHVLIQQQELGGTIAQRLWPAAQKLATYILDNRDKMLGQSHEGNLSILEIGAGVGLTGLELASQLPARVMLTDLSEALPLLRSNTLLNKDQFVLGPDAVQCQPLEWGNQVHAKQALETFMSHVDTGSPILVIGSDCVYWECLHEPLELALFQILSQAPVGSICLLAGMRRWKSDTKFYKMLGKKTATASHRLVVECIDEAVERDGAGREITRIYKIQWLEKARIIQKQAI
jgi:predicted nicotinamide N-methyase